MQLCHEVSEMAFLMPSQLFGIKSLILYGLAVCGRHVESLCMALEMLLIASSLPLLAVVYISSRICEESSISCLICCCNVIKSAAVATPACCQVMRLRLLPRNSSAPQPTPLCDGAYQHSASMSNGTLLLRCNLSQRECVGRVNKCTQQLCDKGNKCAGCNSVKSLCNLT